MMNTSDREELRALRQGSQKTMNRYRFAWWLLENRPNLVVAILQEHIQTVETVQENPALVEPADQVILPAARRGKK